MKGPVRIWKKQTSPSMTTSVMCSRLCEVQRRRTSEEGNGCVLSKREGRWQTT